MDILPNDVWQVIVTFCAPCDCAALRALNKAMCAMLARLAFPRTLNDAAAQWWFFDPAFQDTVAATMARPDRDLHVAVGLTNLDIHADEWYLIGAAAKLSLRPTPSWLGFMRSVRMPRLSLRGSIGQLTLERMRFDPERWHENEYQCTTISILELKCGRPAFPRQLARLTLSRNDIASVGRALRFVERYADIIPPDTLTTIYVGREPIHLPWRDIRNELLLRQRDTTIN